MSFELEYFFHFRRLQFRYISLPEKQIMNSMSKGDTIHSRSTDASAASDSNRASAIARSKIKSGIASKIIRQQFLTRHCAIIMLVHSPAKQKPAKKAKSIGPIAKTIGLRIKTAKRSKPILRPPPPRNCIPGQPVKILVGSQ